MVPPAPRRPPPSGIPISERLRSSSRNARALSLSVVLSAVVHLVTLIALLLAPALSRPGERHVYAPDWLIELARPLGAERLIVLEALNPRVAAAPERAPAPTPLELPDLVESAPALAPPAPQGAPGPNPFVGAEAPAEPSGGGGAEGAGGGGDGPRTAAERLRPGEKSPLLWFVLPEEVVGLSTQQRLELELALAIGAMGDSAAAVAMAARPFRDWTFVDDQGRRWGVADGTIYLGGLVPPIPFGFAPPPNSLAARRTREDAEIAAQAARQEVRGTLRDRAAEIRRRRDAERARSRGDTIRSRTFVEDR